MILGGMCGGAGPERPDPEVPERARRRTFTAKYKLEILAAYDAAADGEKGALLRREGLYSSHIVAWRRARDAGALAALAAPRGRKPRDKRDEQIAALSWRSSDWSRSWPRPASWWKCRQNCTRSWRRSPRAPTPSRGRRRDRHRDRRAGPEVGVRAACEVLGAAQAGYYRRHRKPATAAAGADPAPGPPPAPGAERGRAASHPRPSLHSDRFVDVSPTEVWATLLDEGVYLGSISTFYRLLRQAGESRERRRQATHPATVKPELVATNRTVWSWDITKLRGPAKWTYYYLYVILDIYSRYVVGWMVATRESAALAEVLIARPAPSRVSAADQLTIHADRGSSMTSKPVAFLLADLGVTQSHCRPHVSDDNPYSEAQFKTLKYRPDFPDRFASIEAARLLCQNFFAWYNDEHRHTGLGLHTPADVHYGTAEQPATSAPACSTAAYAAHPERFVRKPPEPPNLPTASWINPPDDTEEAAQ